MKRTILYPLVLAIITISLSISSCDKDPQTDPPAPEPEPTPQAENNLIKLESPYLICAGRNPGGVGFDFEYMGEAGGANNMDSLSVADFEFDLRVRVVKGALSSGGMKGAPFIKLNENVQAVNYSEIDTDCKGIEKFNTLKVADLKPYTLQSDDASFDITNLPTAANGQPLMSELKAQYAKLVIGEKWKAAANNNTPNDEPIWIVKTREGKLVKFIVTDFPANPAPTPRGYIAIEWDFLN